MYNMCVLCASLVRRYDEMADKLSGHPEDTEALVKLQHLLNTVSCLIQSVNYCKADFSEMVWNGTFIQHFCPHLCAE